MKKDQVFVDEHGATWITAAKVADIWNQIALEKYGVETKYTRWSVYQRREQIPYLDTPLGRLFREDKIADVPLRPRTTKREDTTARNIQRKRETSEKKEQTDGDGSRDTSVMLMLRENAA